jgi:antitoxin component of MazEF toxin-antitoxin module
MKKWTAYVEQDGEDLVLPLPADLIKELGWKMGDTLLWDMRDDGSIHLSRKLNWYQSLWKRITSWRK